MVDPATGDTARTRVAGDTARTRVARVTIAAVVVVVGVGFLGAIPFFVATTLTGDDHLFLAFSRYAPNPLVAFVRDQHGGEFYRPIPMILWWVLGRLVPGAAWPFAALACLLHVAVAGLVGALVFSVRRDLHMAAIAAGLFFVAPFTRDAAYWYAGSTDLLATAFGVGAVVALLRGRAWGAGFLLAAACWSKESAVVVPVLAALVLRAREPNTRWSEIARRVLGLLVVVVAYLSVRVVVLRGMGGSGDVSAPLWGKVLQIGAGLVHAVPGSDILTESLAWTIGIASSVALLFYTVRLARLSGHPELRFAQLAPLSWIVLSVLPLLAAPWIVGSRYFYLAAVAIAWLAAQLLRRTSAVVVVGVFAALAGLDLAQATARRADVISYDTRLAAARRAVTAGLARGYSTFHVACGIKDIDLAIKEDPEFAQSEDRLVVLGDVPASFIAIPQARAREFDFLVARPALPPAGAYRFGDRRIVGLARRGDDPGIDEVVARLPALRFIRLRRGPGGHIVYRDVTEALRDAGPDPQ